MPLSGKRQFRKRQASSSSEEGNDGDKDDNADPLMPDLDAILKDTKEIQKMRHRPHGVTAAALALGAKLQKPTGQTGTTEVEEEDPWKTGGLVDTKEAAKDRDRDRTQENEKDMVNMQSTFAAETNQRDEDAEMCKYIEEEMLKRKRGNDNDGDDGQLDQIEMDPVFQALPEHLRTTYRKKGEEMLSSQMLSGIPEVDLGITEKIRNIEETEKAKKKLLDKKIKERQLRQNSFAPANMAVNFVQHNRFNLEEPKRTQAPTKAPEPEKPQPMVVGMAEKNPALASGSTGPTFKGRPKPDSASDDYHFDKFKKAMRR